MGNYKYMSGILSRVLSQEIGNQWRWKAEDEKSGMDNNRDEIVDEVKKFMEDHQIVINPDYFWN